MMHVFIQWEMEKLSAAALDIANETRVRLFSRLIPTSIPKYQMFELTVGEATLDLTLKDIIGLFQVLFDKAQKE